MYVRTMSGARYRRRVYAKTEQEAVRKHRALLAQAERGLPDIQRRLGEYLDYWLEHYVKTSLRAHTYEQYASTSRLYLKSDLGKRTLSDLTVAMLQRYFNHLISERVVSVRKAQMIKTVLSACLTRAMREELIYRNVARLVQLPKCEPMSIQAWTRSEGMTFLSAARSDRLYPAFVLLLFLGLRSGELLGLRWRDVNFERGEIRIRQQLQRINGTLTTVPLKTHASVRELPLGPTVRQALVAHKQAQEVMRTDHRSAWAGSGDDDEFVFTTRIGTPMQDRTLRRSLRRICLSHGIRPVRIHDARHFFATMLKDAGVSARDAQFLLGHATAWTTSQIYQHDDMQSRVIHINKLERLLASPHGGALIIDQQARCCW